MPDLSKLSDAELEAIAAGKPAPKVAAPSIDVSKLSDDELKHAAEFGALPPKSALQSAIETIHGFSAGAGAATPFGEVANKLGAAGYAAGQSAADLFRSPENQKSFVDYYNQGRQQTADLAAKEMAAAPKAASAGKVLGAANAVAAPVPGANMKGLAGVGARIAGNAGYAALDQGTSGDKLFDPEKAQQAATTAGEVQTVLEAIPVVGKGFGAVSKATGLTGAVQKVGNYLSDTGAVKAVKAAFGNTEKAWKSIPADETKDIGKNLATAYEDIGPVVGPFSTASGIEKAATVAKQKIADKLAPIHAEATANNVFAEGGDVAARLIDKGAKIPDTEINKSAINLYQKIALEMEHKGKLSLDQLQALKDSYIYKEADPRIKEIGKDVINNVNKAITEVMKDTIKSSHLPNKDKYADLISRYDSYTAAANASAQEAAKASRSSGLGLRDAILTGTGAAIGGAALGGEDHRTMSAVGAGLLGIGSKLARSRGDAGLARAATFLGNAFQKSPEFLSKYSTILGDAIQRGPAGFAAAHAMLMEHDPQYKNIIENKDVGTPNVFQRKLQNMQPGNR